MLRDMKTQTHLKPDQKGTKRLVDKWNTEKQLWFVSYGNVLGTALEKYIDVDGFDK